MDYYSKSGNGPTGKNKSVVHLLAFRQQLWLLHCNQTVVMIFRWSSAFLPLIRLAAHKCLYNKACFYSDWQTFRSLIMLSSWFLYSMLQMIPLHVSTQTLLYFPVSLKAPACAAWSNLAHSYAWNPLPPLPAAFLFSSPLEILFTRCYNSLIIITLECIKLIYYVCIRFIVYYKAFQKNFFYFHVIQ